MSVFGMPEDSRADAAKLDSRYGETVFDLPQEITAAMRLMANPAAGMMAMSALGFGIASHMFGLWAGAVAGAAQASQQLLTSQAAGQGSAEAAAPPVRARPALKVVAKNEPLAREPVVVPLKPTEAAAPLAPSADKKQAATERPRTVARADDVKPAVAQPKPTTEPAGAGATLLPEDFHKPRSLERPGAPDDLKAISGIGPKLEKVLNDLGVWTYAQIAAWEPREVAWVDDYLSFRGRIERDGWIGQAAKLTGNGKRKGK
jgi:NADH-quinone oxidoreductase subunit E